MRGQDVLTRDGEPAQMLDGRPLWSWTLEEAVACDGLDQIIVAHDDPRLSAHMASWARAMRPPCALTEFRRAPALSEDHVSTVDVIMDVTRSDPSLAATDYIMLLEVTHPFRPKSLLDQCLAATDRDRPSSVIAVHADRYCCWWVDQRTAETRRLASPGPGSPAVYREMLGICSVFSRESLRSDDPFGPTMEMIPIDRFWASIDVRDELGLWLAGQYLTALRSGTPPVPSR